MKKTLMLMIACMFAAGVIFTANVASAKEMVKRIRDVQGEVLAVNPGQHAIVVYGMSGDRKNYIIPATVEPSTKILLNGKEATLSEVNPGDIVKFVYNRTSNLYARDISDIEKD